MSRESMQSLPGSALVRKYIDKRGQNRRVGIPSKLKQSQFLIFNGQRVNLQLRASYFQGFFW